jgi:SAM-dependent methyltransferase
MRAVAEPARSESSSSVASQRQQNSGDKLRASSFGQREYPALRAWIRDRILLASLLRSGRPYNGKRLVDVGCGFRAVFTRTLLDELARAILIDVAIAPDLKAHPRVTAIEGALPDALTELPSQSVDVVVCSAVLEHLWEPLETLKEFPRVLAPGGVALINVPSWLGKRVLEFLAFRLGMSAGDEIDDHKAYYSARELWPLLVKAGFAPHNIKCYRQLVGVNTLAVCRVD